MNVQVEGVNFNAASGAKKTQTDFVKLHKPSVFVGRSDQETLLKEAHAKCVEAVKPPKTEQAPAQETPPAEPAPAKTKGK